MKPILNAEAPIHFGTKAYTELRDYIIKQEFSVLVVLVDYNTEELCLPHFLDELGLAEEPLVIAVPAGEEFKAMGTCVAVIDELSNQFVDRKALLVNLGGGVITDMGGFIASIYKRGMQYVNVPTTLLSMVDASVGGKTGVDLGSLKNQIGVINNGGLVVVDPAYLKTLSKRELLSGFAEVVKHGLISNTDYWEAICAVDPTQTEQLVALIYDSVVFKNKIVKEDPTEQGIRKVLNYGHTLGHAIETYCLEVEDKPALLHGEAIVIGLILETFISVEQLQFPKEELEKLITCVAPHYTKTSFNKKEIEEIIGLMIYDKKNVGGEVNFVLLEGIGAAVLNQQVTNDLIHKAFEFYLNKL